ncbi:MAG: zinc ribbon domain-containing protein, partial [Lachnospiraceae bacterium]|nr:zinc ribbon domain-containing protein [Lachnospiraceae bacterium]
MSGHKCFPQTSPKTIDIPIEKTIQYINRIFTVDCCKATAESRPDARKRRLMRREDKVMKCSKCGADFPDDAKFCPYCGRRVSVPAKGKGEAEGVKELTLGLVKLLGSALGVSVLLNMKLLLEQDGEPSKATEKVEDMLRSADLYGEKEEAAVKEAEEFCREMNNQVSDAVSEAVGSVTGNLEKAFTGIGKVVGKVASEFEKAVAKAEPDEKAEEA